MGKEDIPNYVLSEYEKAQDSAEHHNSLMWNLIYIGIGLSLFILYIFLKGEIPSQLIRLFLVFGAIVLAYFSFIIHKSNIIKFQKYRICKEIEEKYKGKFNGQHRKIEEDNIISHLALFLIKSTIFYAYIIAIGDTLGYILSVFIIFEVAYFIRYVWNENKQHSG